MLLVVTVPSRVPAALGRAAACDDVGAQSARPDATARRWSQKLAGNAALPPEIVAEIVERTDGVPLFVEELTKAVLERPAHETVAAVLSRHRRIRAVGAGDLACLADGAAGPAGPAAKEIAQAGAASAAW